MVAVARAQVRTFALFVGLLLSWCCLSWAGHSVMAGAPQKEDRPMTSYTIWSNGPSPDPDYFPIGVWLQDPQNATRYKAAGINLYVGLWQGPTKAQLAALSAAGVQVICFQNEVGLAHRDDPTIVAWMNGHEPDNAQRQTDGSWGGPVPTEKVISDYQRISVNDSTRPVLLVLGQGVANDEWVGRAADLKDYEEYIKGADIASFDVYPVAGIRREDGERYLWYVAKGIDRLRLWSDDTKPVWNVIETTRIKSQRGPTPSQVEAEVWMSLIHGSRGIVYFAHEWEPEFREARLLEDPDMLAAVTRVNEQVTRLAPVLNSGNTVSVMVTSSTVEIPIDALAKRHGEDLYVFAVPMRLGEAEGNFAIEGLAGRWVAEVIGEGRVVEIVDGRFSDSFDIFQVHRYRVVGAFH